METIELKEGGDHTHNIPPDDLAQLLSDTNFTKREIVLFYKYAAGGDDEIIRKAEFAKICFEQGIRNANLVERMYHVFDENSDGQLTHFELVKGLNPLLRGTKSDVAGFFFELYDIDGNDDLSAAEIISVYSDMLNASLECDRDGLTSNEKKRILLWVQDHQQARAQIAEATESIQENTGNKGDGDKNDNPNDDGSNKNADVVVSIRGTLDKEAFIKAVEDMEEPHDASSALWSYRTLYFVFLTAWFEMGTSFALPAMGALSDRIKERFDITDDGIGTLTSAYFFAAMVGPLAGGIAMQKWGPNITIIGANVIVTLGAMCQAIADGPDQFWLIVVGRLLLGFGGEITPFTTVEILGRLFPDYFGLMAGVRNLVQSISGFLAFVLLPIWADAFGEGNDGTTFALWMCAVMGAISIVTCVITYFSMKKEDVSSEEQSDQKTITNVIRGFAKATTPEIPGCRRWMLPSSFFFAVFGIKAQYFAPFSFTAFSNQIYRDKFGRSKSQASFLSGFISLLAGLMSPAMGELSDRFGKRSICLAIASSLSVVGFGVLASSSGGGAPVWIASTLFALQYGFGDTVAYISIRFIVGVNRAGIGYGLYGVFGNLLATLAPLCGGFLMESTNGTDKVLWYFCGLMLIGTVCWVMVYLLEGKRSLLELPAAQVIETSDEDLQLAALAFVVSPPVEEEDTSKEAKATLAS